jgi:hypothetical protein
MNYETGEVIVETLPKAAEYSKVLGASVGKDGYVDAEEYVSDRYGLDDVYFMTVPTFKLIVK